MAKLKPFDIALIAIFAAIIFVQEYILQWLPNIQLTILLIVLFSKRLGLLKSILIVFVYVLIDSFVMGFNIIYFPFILIGWLILPITLNTIFKQVKEPLYLALLGILYSFLYSWIYLIPNGLLTNVNLIDYLKADIWFEIILALSSFLSILWLYKPLDILLEKILKKD